MALSLIQLLAFGFNFAFGFELELNVDGFDGQLFIRKATELTFVSKGRKVTLCRHMGGVFKLILRSSGAQEPDRETFQTLTGFIEVRAVRLPLGVAAILEVGHVLELEIFRVS